MTPLSAAEIVLSPAPGLSIGPLSFDVAPGEVLLVRGANGTGKSTLLAALAGLVPVESGRLVVPSTAAYIPQGSDEESHVPLGVDEVLALSQSEAGSAEERRAARAATLAKVGLPNVSKRRLSSLSGGERQRVRFAAALLHPAPSILLDEATSAVDEDGERLAAKLLVDHVATTGRTAVVVTHRIDAWSATNARVLELPTPTRGSP